MNYIYVFSHKKRSERLLDHHHHQTGMYKEKWAELVCSDVARQVLPGPDVGGTAPQLRPVSGHSFLAIKDGRARNDRLVCPEMRGRSGRF
ncbi:hypothetical protein EVAR_22766_1 [Eumeta japonica]|uniref:Uncharacterized protein n=1 Tax=Eumeta variegata TaxID=151549 RepID=A0A4C1USE4_EUMVA|nr:hypothetical protein EVAR_22766_1 [Eumeta japonica]